MSNTDYKHLFGPVPSRRFGRSLGVDLTPPKTCTIDCVFCQLGRTTNSTLQRREWIPTAAVVAELDRWIAEDGEADVITFAGSGEPTLHVGLGEITAHIRNQTDIPVLLLTNGTLLHREDVRRDAARANKVKVSLSAWDEDSFQAVNRPSPGCTFAQLVAGEMAFREQFNGELVLEVFVVEGLNSASENMKRIAEFAAMIRPDRVQLNTAVRPPAERDVLPVPPDHLNELARFFEPAAEVIAQYSAGWETNFQANEGTILQTLQRRPCTADQLAEVFSMHRNEIAKYLGKLLGDGAIQTLRQGGELYYKATD